jgi:CTP synthase
LSVARQPVDGSGRPPNVCVIELGGTLGDIESMPFVEALRQLQDRVGYKNCCFLHVSMVPAVGGEQKTKPTQHSVRVRAREGTSHHATAHQAPDLT